jgi:DNA repair protein REV1
MDEYLINKRRKIQETNGHIEQISSLFKGKSFYLNGYLDGIGYGDFKALILKRGGIVYDYLSSKVTHIIASTMTNSKLIQIKKPIIKPDWVHDCILHDRIISLHSYLLNPLQNNMVLDFGKVDASENDSKELNLDDPFIRQNTTLDPDFLNKFFAKSRLHHLTSWKHELIDYVYQKMKNKTVKNYQKRSIMHVDLDAFFVSVSLLDKPQLKHLPVVIAHSSNQLDESTSEIASCNYVSRGFGIKNGMLLRTAKIKCPELHVLPYDFVKYRQVSSRFFDVLLKYANQIQVNSCDEAIIDVSNQTDSGSGIIEVAEMIRKDVFEATGMHDDIL